MILAENELRNLSVKPKSKNIKDTESFKTLAVVKYGDKYDYSKSEYTGATNKITITCREHGDFQIRPNAHTGAQSQGCPACGNRPKMSTEDFIKKSKELYEGRFEYNKVSYTNADKKVTITCKKHGDFHIKPNNHYNGNGGCKECSGRPDLTTESIIERLFFAFGDKYDLSKVKYTGGNNYITLICPQHGEFKKIASQSFGSLGCPRCLDYTLDDFVENANKIHSN